MDISTVSHKALGTYGERAAALYLERKGFHIRSRNSVSKRGEIDIVAQKGNTLHIIEVKTRRCDEFPENNPYSLQTFHPANNLHQEKLRRVKRIGEWYAARCRWQGDLQVDAVLVWVRTRDSVVRVSYLPQIL